MLEVPSYSSLAPLSKNSACSRRRSMSQFPLLCFFFLAFLSLASTTTAIAPWNRHSRSSRSSVRVAYWPAYAAEQYPASAIKARLFTHLNYAFVQLDKATNTVVPSPDDNGHIRSFSAIVKARNPAVRTLLSIGGGSSDALAFSAMAASATSRQSFINSSIVLARENGFDGLDLDWEFPQSDQDMANLGLLFAEWRAAMDSHAKTSACSPLLLTGAVYYTATVQWVGAGTYPTDSINANLDWVNIMAFDYHGSWEPNTTGAHTALFDPNSPVSTDAGLTKWFQAGLATCKAVLGLAMYGHSWILKDPSSRAGIGAPAAGPGPGDATPTFAGIAKLVANDTATVVYDNVTVTAYVQAGSLWVGFDNAESIANKVSYLKKREMRGYFFWTASFDSHWLLSTTAALALGS